MPVGQTYAQPFLGLPEPGTLVSLTAQYRPTLIKGLTVHKDNPFLFDFILRVGEDSTPGKLQTEGNTLIKYFLAALAIPEKDAWVNLSPYEQNRIAPELLSQTEMGQDLLAQDYLLKQVTASLAYPEGAIGQKFWGAIYDRARQMYGENVQIPVNTFNKVWITADKAEVFEKNQTVFVTDSHLKVMLEEDYLAMSKNQELPARRDDRAAGVAAIVRNVILPELEREVNTGKHFAKLRQIFHSVILANWYKNNLKAALLNQVYADQSKIKGIDLTESLKSQIYERYLAAYKKGVFNYVKEDASGTKQPRKYFSGGIAGLGINPAMGSVEKLQQSISADEAYVDLRMRADLSRSNAAMTQSKSVSSPRALRARLMSLPSRAKRPSGESMSRFPISKHQYIERASRFLKELAPKFKSLGFEIKIADWGSEADVWFTRKKQFNTKVFNLYADALADLLSGRIDSIDLKRLESRRRFLEAQKQQAAHQRQKLLEEAMRLLKGFGLDQKNARQVLGAMAHVHLQGFVNGLEALRAKNKGDGNRAMVKMDNKVARERQGLIALASQLLTEVRNSHVTDVAKRLDGLPIDDLRSFVAGLRVIQRDPSSHHQIQFEWAFRKRVSPVYEYEAGHYVDRGRKIWDLLRRQGAVFKLKLESHQQVPLFIEREGKILVLQDVVDVSKNDQRLLYLEAPEQARNGSILLGDEMISWKEYVALKSSSLLPKLLRHQSFSKTLSPVYDELIAAYEGRRSWREESPYAFLRKNFEPLLQMISDIVPEEIRGLDPLAYLEEINKTFRVQIPEEDFIKIWAMRDRELFGLKTLKLIALANMAMGAETPDREGKVLEVIQLDEMTKDEPLNDIFSQLLRDPSLYPALQPSNVFRWKKAVTAVRGDGDRLRNGGIDLDMTGRTSTKKASQGVDMTVNAAMVERIRNQGFDRLVPQVLGITPISRKDIWLRLGL